jgi:hypothetical protein
MPSEMPLEKKNTVTSDAELPTALSRSELKYWDR